MESFNGRGKIMFTISQIIADINRGCTANNLNEACFSYRVIYYVNEYDVGTKHYEDCSYDDLRKTLESIIRENITLTNSVSVAQTTVRKGGKCVCLQSKSYSFSLNEYFERNSSAFQFRLTGYAPAKI